MGDKYLRKLLVIGMTALVRRGKSKPKAASPWLVVLLARKPTRVVTVALANKAARVSGLFEVVPAFFGCVEIADVTGRSPKGVDGPGLDAAEMGLEFGERHLDRVEVGAVGREEEEPCAAFLEDRLGFFALVAREIVEDDHISPAQGRRELGLDVGLEDVPVYRRIDDPGRGQPIMTKGCDKRLRAPMAERCAGLEPCSFARTPSQSGHLGGGCSFIDEDQPVRLFAHPWLASAPPCSPPFDNVSASGFVRQQRLFF